jgi:hypothetical protein
MEFQYGWMADPVYFGDYPASMHKFMGDKLPKFTPEESVLLKGSQDYFACKWVNTGASWALPVLGLQPRILLTFQHLLFGTAPPGAAHASRARRCLWHCNMQATSKVLAQP